MTIDDALTYLPPLLGAIIFGTLGVIVALSRPKTRPQQIFQYYLLAMFFWSLSALLTLSGLANVLLWFRIMTVAPIIMTIAIFFFVQALFGLRHKWTFFVYLYGILVIPLALLTPYLISSASFAGGKLHYEFGGLIFVVAILGYGLNFISLAELTKGYRRSSDVDQRNRLRYLILALSITISATLINFTELGKYPFDIAANTISAMLIAYAILRHRLLDIRVVFRLGLLYSVTSVILGIVYFLAISLSLRLVPVSSGSQIFLLSAIVAVFTAVIFAPVREAAQHWIDRVFYRERYDASLMLQRLSQATTSLLNLDRIAEIVLQDVVETMHIGHAAIFLKDNSDNGFHLLAQKGEPDLPAPVFGLDHPIVRWLAVQNKILPRKTLDVLPIFRSIWKNEIDYLNEFPAELFIPLGTRGELVGFMIVSAKRSAQSYSQDDELILSTLTNQTAVVIENARLYEDLESTFIQTVGALANAIDMRDSYLSSHSEQIAKWAAEVARLMGCNPQEVQAFYWGGLLHDIGKIGIADSILNKPAKLDAAEWEIIRTHTILGAQIVSPIKKLSNVAPIIEYSHERYNGSGYPLGLKGEEIPLGARIIGVVDSYSAMRDERSYKKPVRHEDAIAELERNAGILFDREVVKTFLAVIQNEK
jgi:putative nucleotidyltransferase with HDIG domain